MSAAAMAFARATGTAGVKRGDARARGRNHGDCPDLRPSCRFRAAGLKIQAGPSMHLT
jgi:hypothetical protein